MINKKHNQKLVDKVARLVHIYEDYLIDERVEIDACVYETCESLYSPPEKASYKPITIGQSWGEPFGYGWFRLDFDKAKHLAGKDVFLFNQNDAVENLVFVNGVPSGMFDALPNKREHWRVHKFYQLPDKTMNDTIYLEGYASHLFVDSQPYDTLHTFARGDTKNPVYEGIYVVTLRQEVREFLEHMHILNSQYNWVRGRDEFLCAKLTHVYERVFAVINQMPSDGYDKASLISANIILEDALKAVDNKSDSPFVGLVGHSHLDTAWLWTVEESKHKLARTVSNAVKVLKANKNYKFMLSTVLYMDWLKNLYPSLYQEVVELIKDGRFEINGAVWVECDCNITGGEAMVRQFLKGQKWLKDNLGFYNDSFWLPDTFGYSKALPQIMLKSNVKYFLTTKMSWNDTNVFPYDTFYWSGLDGSTVLTHLNTMYGYADAESISRRVDSIPNKHLSTSVLIAYGFGDGGGGPDLRMSQIAQRSSGLEGVARAEHLTVSDFMTKLATDSQKERYPIYNDELYLELHRGTFTTNHSIKKLNRQLENRLRDAELISALMGVNKHESKAITDQAYSKLLINQFHDILPGTCITEVYPLAEQENLSAIEECTHLINRIISDKAIKDNNSVTVFNTLGFDRNDVFELEGEYTFQNAITQSYSNIDGEVMTAVMKEIPALSGTVLTKGKNSSTAKSLFRYERINGDGVISKLETPFATISFNDNMEIISLRDKRNGRETVKGLFNAFQITDDVPKDWDNWDIDPDYLLKSKKCSQLLSSEIVSEGDLELRIRNHYRITDKSELWQDVVFYSNTAQIDYFTKLVWGDVHKLLKAVFETNISADLIRNEIQFGYVSRSVNSNNSLEQAKFEVCNHKYSDLSENDYGIAFLNDCKYGLSCRGSEYAFTLLKSGTHPNVIADNGTHYMTYSILPHDKHFGAGTVVMPAYQLNIKPLLVDNVSLNYKAPISVDKPNIIVETIKVSEDQQGIVIRLYECERNRTKAKIRVTGAKNVELVNMLEESISQLEIIDDHVEIDFAPFEIVTLKIN